MKLWIWKQDAVFSTIHSHAYYGPWRLPLDLKLEVPQPKEESEGRIARSDAQLTLCQSFKIIGW